MGIALPRRVHRLPCGLHARAAGHHPDGGPDHHAADRGGRFRQGLVLRAISRHAADRVPNPADRPSIFYPRGIAPPEITLRHMYVGIWRFIALQLLVVCLLVAFPKCVTWLPYAVLTGFR